MRRAHATGAGSCRPHVPCAHPLDPRQVRRKRNRWTYEVGESVAGDEGDDGLLGDLTLEGKRLVEAPVELHGTDLLTSPAFPNTR